MAYFDIRTGQLRTSHDKRGNACPTTMSRLQSMEKEVDSITWAGISGKTGQPIFYIARKVSDAYFQPYVITRSHLVTWTGYRQAVDGGFYYTSHLSEHPMLHMDAPLICFGEMLRLLSRSDIPLDTYDEMTWSTFQHRYPFHFVPNIENGRVFYAWEGSSPLIDWLVD